LATTVIFGRKNIAAEANMKLLIVLLTLFLPACETDAPVEPKLGEEFTIGYGKSITLENGSVTVAFLAVTEDSRCPEGAVCFWEGNARVLLSVTKHEFGLNTTLSPKDTTIGAYNVRLVRVDPYPKLNVERRQEEYIVTLVMDKI
jgi:hypothetical protein